MDALCASCLVQIGSLGLDNAQCPVGLVLESVYTDVHPFYELYLCQAFRG
jgi:hypothetical protein